MTRRIAIVAKAGTSVLAPWDDPSWEIWTLPWIAGRRADRYFDVHEQSSWDISPVDLGDWYDRCFLHKEVPVYTVESRVWRYENPVVINVSGLLLENSICFQIAQAIDDGDIGEIGLYGVHMTSTREYLTERIGVAYWVGRAEGMGIKVTVPPGSPLLMSCWVNGRYGRGHARRNMN